jgi:hypothetical protein
MMEACREVLDCRAAPDNAGLRLLFQPDSTFPWVPSSRSFPPSVSVIVHHQLSEPALEKAVAVRLPRLGFSFQNVSNLTDDENYRPIRRRPSPFNPHIYVYTQE